jgi:hypothetical protein
MRKKSTLLRSLEHHAFGDRHAGGGAKFAIFDTSPRRRVKHFTALRAAGRRIDIPTPCRRRHEHGPRDRTGLAQGLPRRAYRVRVASCLHSADQGVAVQLSLGGACSRSRDPVSEGQRCPPPAFQRSASGWRCSALTLVPQRQMLPDIASSILESVGCGLLASSAEADIIWPDWQ